MKRLPRRLCFFAALLSGCGLSQALTIPAGEDTTSFQKQITATTSSAPLLTVDATHTGFVYFDLDDIPKGTAVQLARLRVYLPNMTARGNGISVHLVTGQWNETVSVAEPRYDATPVVKMDAANLGSRRFVTVDVTTVVQNWINLKAVNEGFALVSVPTGSASVAQASVTIAAKEGSNAGLPAQLDIELAATGPAGPAGAQGLRGLQGVAGPQGTKGDKGDTGAQGPIGLTGAKGDTGPAGMPGASGKTIFSGSLAPTSNSGGIGDFYLNTASASLYGPKTAKGWGLGVSLIGPRGETGAKGPQGDPGIIGADTIQSIVDAAVKAAVEAVTPLISGTAGSNAGAVGVNTGTTTINTGTVGSSTEGIANVLGGTLPAKSQLAGQVVGDFKIGKYEVTWGEWKTVRDWAVQNGYTDLANVGAGNGNNYPVTNVSWYEVVKWCNARSEKEQKTPVYQVNGATYKSGKSDPTVKTTANGYRLPTEAEWEWAARGGQQTKGYTYSGSSDLTAAGLCYNNSGGSTNEVGTKVSNELTIYDMSGNVSEWCMNWLSGYEGSYKAIRGGDWSDYTECAVSSRGGYVPGCGSNGTGFRVALSSTP